MLLLCKRAASTPGLVKSIKIQSLFNVSIESARKCVYFHVNVQPDLRWEGLTNIAKSTSQVPHHQACICKSDLPVKKQGCQQIDRNFQFPFIFDTESEVLHS